MKTILITGAGGGLGHAQVLSLTKSGYRIIALDNREESLDQLQQDVTEAIDGPPNDGAVIPVKIDVGDLDALDQTVRKLTKEFDIGGLVHNAAVVHKMPLNELTIEMFEDIQRINAHSQFVMAKALSEGMKSRQWGRIVSIGSAMLGGIIPEFSGYLFAKGSLYGLTRSLARELGTHGDITVNLINPGAVTTRLEMEGWGDQWEAFNASVLEHQSIKRRVTPEDVAGLVSFLIDGPSHMLTGHTFSLDGGWVMH